jgi:F0F1-type ATP synthase, subunit a
VDALSKLPDEMNELIDSFMTHAIVGDTTVGLTQYVFWMSVAIILLLVVLLVFRQKQSRDLVPQGFFVNAVEYVVEFVRDDVCKGLLGDSWRVHFPFLAALFFFILFNNIVGILPGCHPGTGTMGVTAALALCSFGYFVYFGCKRKGVGGYVKSLAPSGVAFPINILVAVIEVFSTFLRPITLAIRLFCNMFAGHIVMGTFAILASLFFEPLLQGVSVSAIGDAGVSVFWVFLLLIIYLVEILVAVIQAYVFTLLSAVYVQLVEQDE